MTRLALYAAGLALAAPSAWAELGPGAPLDHDALVQMSKGSLDYSTDIATDSFSDADQESVEVLELEVLGGLSDGYAFEKYDDGALVEGKTSSGKWVPCVIKGLRREHVWDIHVAERLPGFDLPGVPAELLRRRLGKDESDWHVDNSRLQHKGFGIAYRRSKDLNNVSSDYAPFNSIVTGRDEGDGWLKVSQGYLPMKLQGEPVLSERQRVGESKISKELRDWYVKEEEARRKAALASLALQPPPPQHYADSEQVSIKTKDNTWRLAQVASRGLFPDTYNVLVGPSRSIQSIELGVPSSRLQKAGMPKHTPVKGEAPLCEKQGCMMLHLRAESGKEFQFRAVMGLRIAVLMKAACARLHEPWESCQTRIILSHGGRMLSPSWRTYEAGLENEAVVDLKMAPETATPIRSVSA